MKCSDQPTTGQPSLALIFLTGNMANKKKLGKKAACVKGFRMAFFCEIVIKVRLRTGSLPEVHVRICNNITNTNVSGEH